MQNRNRDGPSGNAFKGNVDLRLLYVPRSIVTDNPPGYGATKEEMMPSVARNSIPRQNVSLRSPIWLSGG